MQLNPLENFTIVRQIEDHTDSATYYVRAVIRNAKTDAIIPVNGNNYINLTDRGSQRFSENWLVSADVSGQGFYVSILTSVYTDSNYTTKSQNYGDKIDVYLVQDRPNNHIGGGGGSDVDYKRIKKMIDDAIASIPKPKTPKEITIPKVDIEGPISKLKQEVVAEIRNLPEPTSIAPIIAKLEQIDSKMDDDKSENDDKDEQMLETIINQGNEILGKFGTIEDGQKAVIGETIKQSKAVETLTNSIGSIRVKVKVEGSEAEIEPKDKKETEKVDPRIKKLLKTI